MARNRSAAAGAGALVLLLGTVVGCSSHPYLPPPPPLPKPAVAGLDAGYRARLATLRNALSPADQETVERSLLALGEDPRLPHDETAAALRRALDAYGFGKRLCGVGCSVHELVGQESAQASAGGFCDALAHELSSLVLSGPRASAPTTVAVAVPVENAWRDWLSRIGRRRYADPASLARAIRDGTLEPHALDPRARLGEPGRALFVFDAKALAHSELGTAAALCFPEPSRLGWAIAEIPAERLPEPLRVPTAADAVCRPNWKMPPSRASAGKTCTGIPEYVTAPVSLGAASRVRLAR